MVVLVRVPHVRVGLVFWLSVHFVTFCPRCDAIRLSEQKFRQRRGPTLKEVQALQEKLEDENVEGLRAVNAANMAAAVVKVQDVMSDMSSFVQDAQKQATAARRASDLADGVKAEMAAALAEEQANLKRVVAAKEAIEVGSKGWLATTQQKAGADCNASEAETIAAFSDWEFEAKHDKTREAKIAAYTASEPYKAAIKRIEDTIAAHYAKAEIASQEAFAMRDQAKGLSTAASKRVDPLSAQADVYQINALSTQAIQASAKARALRAKGNELQLQIPTYQHAAEFVAGEAASRFDPSVPIPTVFQEPLPLVGDALVLPVP